MEILQRFGCLDELVPTPFRQIAAAIREIMLWLGLALAKGEFDNLDPHHLAAAIAAWLLKHRVQIVGFATSYQLK